MVEKITGVYRYDDKLTTPDTDTKTFVGKEVGRGKIVELKLGQVTDYTTANKKLILGYRDGGGNDHYVVVVQETNTFEAHLTGKLILLPTEKPIAVVESPKASDVLYCTFRGLIYKRL